MSAGAKPRVAVLYNVPVLPPDHPDALAEADVVDVARAIADALVVHDLDATPVPVRPPVDAVLATIRGTAPDVIFNLIEGFGGSGVGATLLTGLIELSGVPYTGCPSGALACCLGKGHAKALLRGHGLPTAPSLLLGSADAIPEWMGPWPVVVKPDAEDASLGIDQRSVVAENEGLAEPVDRLRDRYGGRVLIEAYLPGPEFNVGVLDLGEPEPLPIAEVVFATGAGDWPILTYASKWMAGSPEDLASPIRCPARIDDALSGELGRLAVAAFRATGCRDYARVDFRLDDRGVPMILEVNPNPDLGPGAGWARALRASGRDYGATLATLARHALARGPAPGAAGP